MNAYLRGCSEFLDLRAKYGRKKLKSTLKNKVPYFMVAIVL